MQFYRARRHTRPIPLTALIDIFFLLVIFFLLATSFVRIQSMELGLPGDDDGKTAGGGLPLTIDIASNGGIYWQRELVLPTTLRARLEGEIQRAPHRKVLVRSGKNVSVQKLVSVLDIAYLAGVEDVAVDTWDERDLADETPEEEQKAIENAITNEDINTPVLDEKTMETLPQGPYSPQDQFDIMLEEAP